MAKIEVIGLDRLQLKLDKIGSEIDKVAHNEIKGMCYDIVATAKDTAPVKTGALRNSITTYPRSGGTEWVVQAGGGPVHYAAYVEYGTVRNRANPFMTLAVRKHTGQQSLSKIADAAISGYFRGDRPL